MGKIFIKNLSFSYGSRKVLKDVNLNISNGLFGLLGRNGAGKTTLMKLIAGLLPVSGESIEVNGKTSIENRRKLIGYLPQDFGFYPEMKVKEALFYLGYLDNIEQRQLKKRVESLLETVNLTKSWNVKIGKLSGGMLRRLGIAQSLLNDPEVLLMDEPTAGLDPEERVRFRNLLVDLSEDKTVIFSTHIASDLESAANTVGILEKGRFIYDGSVNKLLSETESGIFEMLIGRENFKEFRKKYLIVSQKDLSDGVLVKFIHNGRPLEGSRRIPADLESSYMVKISEGGTNETIY